MTRTTTTRTIWAIASVFTLAIAAPAASATPTTARTEVQVLSPDDFPGGGFGSSLAIDGNTAVIGAPNSAGSAGEIGSAHVFVRGRDGRWIESARLVADDGEDADDFGSAVAIDGDRIIVGAPGDDISGTQSGSAYLYEQDQEGMWAQKAKLIPSGRAADGDAFGTAVAISGDTTMVGANWHEFRGTVYVYTDTADEGWLQTQELVGGAVDSLIYFGSSISIDGGTALIGAPSDGSQGATHVFTRAADGSWAAAQKLVPMDEAAFADFGNAVAVQGDAAVIGARFHPLAGDFTGAAYIFERTAEGVWEEIRQLTAIDPMSEDRFGSSVALDDDTVVIGAPGEDDGGAAHVFVRDGSGTWGRDSRLATSGAGDEGLGLAVGVVGDGVLVGAVSVTSEAVYAFSVGFVDDDDSVFEGDIDWMAASGLTKGCNPPTDDRFCPNDVVTRGQAAAFLVRTLGIAGTADDADTFTDDDSNIFEADIEDAAAAGITVGCNPPDNDRFCPDQPVSRGQLAAFLVRAWNIDQTGQPSGFLDIGASVFADDIATLAATNITRGCNPPANDRFCPEQPVTRGEMAAFIRRAEAGRSQ